MLEKRAGSALKRLRNAEFLNQFFLRKRAAAAPQKFRDRRDAFGLANQRDLRVRDEQRGDHVRRRTPFRDVPANRRHVANLLAAEACRDLRENPARKALQRLRTINFFNRGGRADAENIAVFNDIIKPKLADIH